MSEINGRVAVPRASYWTWFTVDRRSGRVAVHQEHATKTEMEVAMEVENTSHPGAYSFFVVMETREDMRPIITVFQNDRA